MFQITFAVVVSILKKVFLDFFIGKKQVRPNEVYLLKEFLFHCCNML